MNQKTIIKTSIAIPTMLLILIVTSHFIGCSKESTCSESLIKVDSITIDYIPTLLPSGLFAIDLHGTISTNGCSSLSYVKTLNQDQDIVIEAWKKTEVNAGACPDVMVYLNYRLIFDKNLLPNTITIKVKQPDGSFLEKQIQ